MLQEPRARGLPTRVILPTSSSEKADQGIAARFTVDAYLLKPARLEEFLEAVEHIHRGRANRGLLPETFLEAAMHIFSADPI